MTKDPTNRDLRPFTKATSDDGGVPKGRISTNAKDNPAGGRHSGALLSDPLQTLQKLEKHREALPGSDAGSNPDGVRKQDADFPKSR